MNTVVLEYLPFKLEIVGSPSKQNVFANIPGEWRHLLEITDKEDTLSISLDPEQWMKEQSFETLKDILKKIDPDLNVAVAKLKEMFEVLGDSINLEFPLIDTVKSAVDKIREKSFNLSTFFEETWPQVLELNGIAQHLLHLHLNDPQFLPKITLYIPSESKVFLTNIYGHAHVSKVFEVDIHHSLLRETGYHLSSISEDPSQVVNDLALVFIDGEQTH